MFLAPANDLSHTDVLELSLIVNEIFFSVQGETSKSGLPTTFIRLTGCPLRCNYCDTVYAFHEGKKLRIKEIMDKVSANRSRHVTVTGGEPLAQKSCQHLLRHLCNEEYEVSLETSGAMDISEVDSRVVKIVDIKTPGSGESEKNRLQNLDYINDKDEIKFVICTSEDYEWAKRLMYDKKLYERCEILFSPSHEEQDAARLADWILRDQLPVRLQIQLHKYLWGDVPGK
jgi:7-carboxy-7-deazaguanine synthase